MTQIFVHRNIQSYKDFANSIRSDIKTNITDQGFDPKNYSLLDTPRIGFAYDNNSVNIPFGLTNLTVGDFSFKYFKKELFDFLLTSQSISSSSLKINVDIITCNLGSSNFKKEIEKLKQLLPNVEINYSVNPTGSIFGSDWITESNNLSIKNIYFNENIDDYRYNLGSMSYHGSFIDNNKSVWGFGYNSKGQLGIGFSTSETPQPTPIQAIDIFSANYVACGGNHTLVLDSDGIVMAYGNGTSGQLGNSVFDDVYIPTAVTLITQPAIHVAAGALFSVVVLENGTAFAFGDNDYGQLGNNDTTTTAVPVQMIGVTNAKAVSAGSVHTALLMEDGTVWSVGFNLYGQLGNETTSESHVVVQAQISSVPLSDIISISCGEYFTAALKSNGTVWVFGNNDSGQFGNGTSGNYSSTPLQVPGITTARSISSGSYHLLIVLANGTVMGCGLNSSGQLGTGNTIDSTTPVEMVGMTNVIAVTAGRDFSLILKNNGLMYGVGNDNYGQLADGASGFDELIPVESIVVPNQKIYKLNDSVRASTFCVHENNLVRTKRGTIPIKDVVSGDIVYDEKNEEVGIKYNIKIMTPTDKFIKIKKHALGENKPNNDLRIVPGHPIKHNSEEINCDKLVGKYGEVVREITKKPHYVYCFCTEQRTYVEIEGVLVCTRSEESWNELTKRLYLSWRKC
jgi:alpha-tubulin suppressor-like RCC1 family protein